MLKQKFVKAALLAAMCTTALTATAFAESTVPPHPKYFSQESEMVGLMANPLNDKVVDSTSQMRVIQQKVDGKRVAMERQVIVDANLVGKDKNFLDLKDSLYKSLSTNPAFKNLTVLQSLNNIWQATYVKEGMPYMITVEAVPGHAAHGPLIYTVNVTTTLSIDFNGHNSGATAHK